MFGFSTDGNSVIAILDGGQEGTIAIANQPQTAVMIAGLLNNLFSKNIKIYKGFGVSPRNIDLAEEWKKENKNE